MNRFFPPIIAVLMMLVAVASFWWLPGKLKTSPAHAAAMPGDQLLVFTANWCANCRQVVPVVNDVARQQQVEVISIDVDASNAPSQAKRYGVGILESDLPHVYLLRNGTPKLVIDGKNYIYGEDAMVRGEILSALGQ